MILECRNGAGVFNAALSELLDIPEAFVVDEKDETYFTHLQKYQHNFSFDVCDIPIYSFNLDSKIDKPNGAVNMSQLKDISMNIETLPVFSKDCHYILDLYAVQYNQLEILNGIGGIKWGN